MTQIINDDQYYWALGRVEELLPLVTEDTPVTDPASIELELLSNLVADYSEAHFSIDNLVPIKMASEDHSDASLQVWHYKRNDYISQGARHHRAPFCFFVLQLLKKKFGCYKTFV